VSTLGLAWRLLVGRLERHLLTAAVVALGVAMMLATAASGDAARGAFRSLAGRYPLVVGGEVGAVPLVLGALTRLQELPGHVDGAVVSALRADPRVEVAVPVEGGHQLDGFAVLGTTPDYLRPRERYPLARGRSFEEGAAEALLGARVAPGLGLGLGDELAIDHDHGGDHSPLSLQVVGVLAETGTDADRTVFVPVEAIQASHGGTTEVGAVLVRPVDDRALLDLQEQWEARPGVQVALTGQTLRRVSDQLAAGGKLLRVLVGGVLAITLLALVLAVYGSALDQAREVAVLRMLGARRGQVMVVMGLISLAVVAAGTVAGVGVGALLATAAEGILRGQLGLEAEVDLASGPVLGSLLTVVALLSLAGIQPAIAAYAVPAAEALADPAGGQATRIYLGWSTRVLVALIVAAWGLQALSTHGGEQVSIPLDEPSRALFVALAGWNDGPPPPPIDTLDGQALTVQGYMYALGDPYTVEDFFLIAVNPRLPRCPFCYRSPGKTERIGVYGGGRTLDLLPGPVSVTGTLRADRSADDPLAIDLDRLDAIFP
jgi:putative ABC transport system permease protein